MLEKQWGPRPDIIYPNGASVKKMRSVSTAQLKKRVLKACAVLGVVRLHMLGLSEPKKDITHQSFKRNFQAKPTWTSEVSEVVAQMARGRLGTELGAVGSSDSEDIEEQQLHLQGWQGQSNRHNFSPHQKSETPESTDLEQLFKCFAGIQSDSEESANFHTINRTFDVTNRVLDATSQTEEEGSSDLDYSQSLVEPSTMFYTPKHYLSNSSAGEEHSQSLSSEEDLDITVEVCRPSTSPAEEKQATDNILNEYQPAQEDSKETESITPVHISCLPDLAEIADLSSISCSPAQHQQWVESTTVPPISHTRGHPPCNSTPRSPRGRRTYLRDVQVGTKSLPDLQSLLDTSPWGSAPSLSFCTESYATARAGDSSTTNTSVSSILQSPAIRDISKEETDSPQSGNAEFTTASSGARQTTETSQGASEDMESPHGNNDVYEEREEVGEDLQQHDQKYFDEKASHNEDISEMKEGCEDEISCLIQDQDLDRNSANVDSNANSHRSTDKSHSLDETERAHSTLDEELQRMLLERATGQRTLRDLGPISQSKTLFSQSDVKGEGDVREEAGCPGGDHIETSGNELGEKLEAANQEIMNCPHSVLEPMPLKSQSWPNSIVKEEPISDILTVFEYGGN
ncbi:inactive serine/threonine-protein kinase TEX14-like [Myxocyprinus asiaticus]|uniref:inactive serine/threonine-protein kinase TEX14-like n=1 Tax=Myxocyprinus asiaticus TaxID=70543 RepID=UPI0022233395|nr:inactive serine/threonine-protein kinase TEX14-like [Myxocyprinus asiaticus]